MRSTQSVIVFTAAPLFAATRLPQNVVPDRYTIAIAPDLANETFSGEETIDVEVKEPVDTITLHSIDLNLKDVRVGQLTPALIQRAPLYRRHPANLQFVPARKAA